VNPSWHASLLQVSVLVLSGKLAAGLRRLGSVIATKEEDIISTQDAVGGLL
jgi:hypothetical protein